MEAKPRRQVGSYSRKPAQFPALIESPIYDSRRYPPPPANREAVGYHKKITYAEAHVYPAVYASRVGTRIAERRCFLLMVTLLKGTGERSTKGRRCVSPGTGEGRGEIDRT